MFVTGWMEAEAVERGATDFEAGGSRFESCRSRSRFGGKVRPVDTEPTLHIRLLGGLSLVHGDQAVTAVHSPRLHSLLGYLLLHRDAPQLRQHLAFTFWPDSSEAQARNNLRQILHELRHALPDADRFLLADARTAGWRADASFELDVGGLRVRAGRGRRQHGAEGPSASRCERAAELYRGELLPGCYDGVDRA